MTCNLHPQDDPQTQRLEVVLMPDPNAADAAASLAAQTSIEGVSLVPDLFGTKQKSFRTPLREGAMRGGKQGARQTLCA